MEISIAEIHKTVELIKQVDCSDSALVADVAKEMGIKKTSLMDFMNQNPYLFKTKEQWSYKKTKVFDYYIGGKPHYYTSDVKDKCKGLAIIRTYPDPVENPVTDEWLQRQKQQNTKTLMVKAWDNYGTKEGLYAVADPEDDTLRTGLWRNTRDKIQELSARGILFPTTFYIGGFGDCSQHKVETATDESHLNTLKEEGWTILYQ